MTRRQPGVAPPGPLLPILVALLLAAAIYALSLGEEPFHIDELRQTMAYDQPVAGVIDAAFAQDQPPLDPVLNSLLQRAIGIGDWKQRLLPAVSGVVAMGILALLLLRSGLRQGAALSVLVMAGSALLTSVFVYARPYAIPSLLMIGFIYASDLWLEDRRKWAAAALFPLALTLPLSRTLEPLLLLAITSVVLLAFRALARPSFQGSIWVPLTAAVTGVAVTGIPVVSRLRDQLGGYTNSEAGTLGDRLSRMLSDVPEGVGRAFPYWPLLVVILVLVFASEPARRWIKGQWWVWVLFALPVGFVTGFVLSVDPGQPLYDRYFFTLVPAIAVLVALAWENRDARFRPLSAAAIALLIVWMALTQYQALTTKERGDWQALSATIEAAAPSDAVIVVEHAGPLGAYRPFYYGQPRYLAPEWDTQSPLHLIRSPARADRPAPLVLALNGPSISVEGWKAFPVDDFFTLYVPLLDSVGPIGIADGLAAFSAALGTDAGSTLAVASASVYSMAGHMDRACEIIGTLRSSGNLAARLQGLLETQASPLLELECPTAVPPTSSETP